MKDTMITFEKFDVCYDGEGVKIGAVIIPLSEIKKELKKVSSNMQKQVKENLRKMKAIDKLNH